MGWGQDWHLCTVLLVVVDHDLQFRRNDRGLLSNIALGRRRKCDTMLCHLTHTWAANMQQAVPARRAHVWLSQDACRRNR
jgi:hypothetical protein